MIKYKKALALLLSLCLVLSLTSITAFADNSTLPVLNLVDKPQLDVYKRQGERTRQAAECMVLGNLSRLSRPLHSKGGSLPYALSIHCKPIVT